MGIRGNVIGQDLSIETNVKEGYLMVAYNGKIDPGKQYHFFSFATDYIMEENNQTELSLMTDVNFSLNELIERYDLYKKDIDNFCGIEYSLNATDYTYGLMVSLAGVVNSYCGLN